MDVIIIIYFIYISIISVFFLITTLMTPGSKQRNYNYYFRFYLLFLSILPPFIIYLDGFSVHRVGFEMLGLAFGCCVLSIIMSPLFFIKRSKILNWIYSPVFLICLTGYLIHLLNNYTYYDESYLSSIRIFISFFISFLISYLFYKILKNKDKEISLWALACCVESFFWIILKTFFLLTCNFCRHAI
jgi:hypothetical protein